MCYSNTNLARGIQKNNYKGEDKYGIKQHCFNKQRKCRNDDAKLFN